MKYQKGQVLLLVIMLLATILTVTTAITFKSTTETQITKLEEDSQKALAAAEAAIEYVLKTGVSIATLDGLGVEAGITGSATVEGTLEVPTEFITSNISQGNQYTFYLSEPASDYTSFLSSYNGQSIRVCFNNSQGLELTLIKSDNTLVRYAINPTDATVITNGTAGSAAAGSCDFTVGGETVSFNNKYELSGVDVGNDNLFLVIRSISTSGKVGLKGGADFPLQGKRITARATTITGVTKSIELFQSYLQIPADFFVTSL